ncbi:hypothetical protein T08_16328 [Trichinella sp. T8]|nr:hypothetical protein T08_16328 [Trichinella sp. T8]
MDKMFIYIADKSNTYADQNNNPRVHFSRHDIELFVGTMLKMGIILMSRYQIYWSANFRVISITNRLTRNRFIETMQTAFQGLILNAVNYETALTIINEKYGNSQLLIEEHLKSLQNLIVITNQ